MKKNIVTVLLFVSAAFLPKTHAGTAIIPNYHIWDGGGKSCFNISNVSTTSALVNVQLFNRTGAPFNGSVASKYIIDQIGIPFTLEPKKTAFFCLTSGGGTSPGYGVIESQALEPAAGQVFLVAHGYYSSAVPNTSQAFSIPINGGLPF
ncbi:hypothetical protein EOE67_03890 [Rheinheimera riviphila]|uniref:Uncharacterized protein n=1 Tax=Rheinheimera riviphila TaxID=1834037 RepID=A0A437R3I8_9GAMM|nr:hypothetical protein [Rheinheimera riviphila]RVU41349.1 hypothetical protein EOE67_03890 [Rheinheimera riviphila]